MKMSKKAAGVYRQTTSGDVETGTTRQGSSGSGPRYSHLRKQTDIYESDSDEEIWEAPSQR